MRTTIAFAATLALAGLLAASCAQQPVEPGGSTVQQVRFVPPPAAETADEAPSPVPARRLIRIVSLDLRVGDSVAAAERVGELAETAGGYVSDVDAFRVEGLLRYTMTVRVPVERLDDVVAELKRLAVEVEREHLSTEDVTAQFIDLEARLKTLRLTEEELRALLAESRARGSEAKDIMAIYRHLTEIRTGIEQLQGQLAALENRTALSTVHLQLLPSEAARPLGGGVWRPAETARQSLRALLGALEGLGDLAIALAIVAVPLGLILGGLLWLALKGLGRLRRRRSRRPGS